jgi:hypothetical protein
MHLLHLARELRKFRELLALHDLRDLYDFRDLSYVYLVSDNNHRLNMHPTSTTLLLWN